MMQQAAERTAMSERPSGSVGTLRIGLMGPFGYGNLGDGAIVDAMILNLRRRDPDVDLVGFGFDPDDLERRHGIPCHPISRMSWADDPSGGTGIRARAMTRLRTSRRPIAHRIERVASRAPAEVRLLIRSFRSLADLDMLIVCGSGQLQDYWGGGGPFSYPYTLLRWVVLARLRRIRVVLVSVGAGPVHHGLSKRLFRWALALTEYRSFRDAWSKRFVADEIGFDRADPVYPDLAFSLDVEELKHAEATEAGRVIGLNPIPYYRDPGWPESDEQRWLTYLDTMVRLAAELLDRGDRVLFLKGEATYDQLVVDDVIAGLDAAGVDREDRVLTPPITTTAELLDALGQCDAAVVGRFHNVLLGYMLGKPVVALSWQSKIDSLMGEFGQTSSCLPIGEATLDQVLERLDGILETEGFAESATELAVRYRRQLDEQYDHVLGLLGVASVR
jgi:polysaccharide pyruvyl transferase WcaK-like protein